jgi:dienelactone hydrolase
MAPIMRENEVRIDGGQVILEGSLALPEGAGSVVLFAHGSGSSRHSPRNRLVAGALQEAGFGTLLFDLLTRQEDELYENRFNIPLLTERLKAATSWLKDQPGIGKLEVGYFGASTGAAAALMAAADLGPAVGAVVSRGGRPDLAMETLGRVRAPTLLIVGEYDEFVIELNRRALEKLAAFKELVIVPKATHLFEEPGALERVAAEATRWFMRHLVLVERRSAA